MDNKNKILDFITTSSVLDHTTMTVSKALDLSYTTCRKYLLKLVEEDKIAEIVTADFSGRITERSFHDKERLEQERQRIREEGWAGLAAGED